MSCLIKVYHDSSHSIITRNRVERDDKYCFDSIIIATSNPELNVNVGKVLNIDFDGDERKVKKVKYLLHQGREENGIILVIEALKLTPKVFYLNEIQEAYILNKKSLFFTKEQENETSKIDFPFVEDLGLDANPKLSSRSYPGKSYPGETSWMNDEQKTDLAEDIYGVPDPRLVED